ncbi:MAG: hypothetical protein IT292_09920 [Deltaproteobacteria bacterium]|nr:hypothetical protein [Deltaproteobacteria bacterium]
MNRKEFEQILKSNWKKVELHIKGNPIRATSVALGAGFVIGVFRELFVPIILIMLLIGGVLWFIGEKPSAE